MAPKRKRRNYYRLIPQWIITLLLAYMVLRPLIDKSYHPDFEAYCPIGGMQAYSSFLANNTLACSMTTLQIAMGFALILGVILVSKLFCSYICPIGIFTEWLGRRGEKWKIRKTITGVADQLLRLLKYVLLFITFYFTITSSELFCRKYDPFYALFTGFGHDVSLLWALLAIAVTILGSLFVRQFWCKYLCPLGAATNLFAFTLVFLVITVIYAGIRLAGAGLHWSWYLGALCLGGYLAEAFKKTTLLFPLMKVTRHDKLCTNCKICDKVCPYALNISTVDSVRHIDCHLCGDCVTRCPEKGALTYNRRRMPWLPLAAAVVLVGGGIALSSFTQVPTIDLKWGTPEQMANASTYQQSGLKNVKCYGSSMAFANHIKEVEGILGVQTYVKDHRVKIFFDASVITTDKVKAAIFTPVKTIIALPDPDVNQVFSLQTGIDHFFDPGDAALLAEMLKSVPGVFGFETEFGEPVKTLIFYDENKIKPAGVRSLIETKEFELVYEDSREKVKPGFSVAWIKDSPMTVSRREFLKSLFSPYSATFNGYADKDTLSLAVFEIPFPDCIIPEKTGLVPYLRNHLMTADKGTFRFETSWRGEGPVLSISYDPAKTTPEAIYLSITRKTLHIEYKNGEKEDMENPFSFPPPGEVKHE